MSATVIAPKCLDADALATLLMVMNWKDGLDLINNLTDTECLIILERSGNILEEIYSDGLSNFIVD